MQVCARQLLERIHDIGVSLLKGSKEEKEGRAAETVNPLKFLFFWRMKLLIQSAITQR